MRLFRFEQLMEAVEALALLEDMTYDQLFRMSDPKRFDRSLTVKMPPMEVEQFQSAGAYVFRYYFNAKGNPSTTGLRHRGFVQFKKPKTKGRRNMPLSQLPVEVDCMCPDYRYRWAWANKQRRAGKIGPASLNQCINKAPRKTNPSGKPGLCKHILATRNYIYGLLSGLPDSMGPTDKLDKLTRQATKRWLNFDADMQKARERDAKIAAAKARRNVGVPPYEQNKLVNKLQAQEPPEIPEPQLAVPPGQRGRGFPPQPPQPPQPPKPPKPPKPPSPPQSGKVRPPAGKPSTKPAPKTGKSNPKQGSKPTPKPGRGSRKVESVDMMTMKTLTLQEAQVVGKARKLVEEMAEELGGIDDMGGGIGDMPPASGADMPAEPPVSDSAIGASTEDNVALGLLREIRDLLAEIAADDAMEEGGGAPELPPEEEEGALPGEEGTGEDEFKPGKRPMPVPSGAGGE
jgi:hypothetical protein